ncbi:MAG: RNA polymerase sigma factor [Syntrophobacteraceae bacterium]|nr:RNA polymerase sigma factor [Syntrophobacteraceae bacterium]
MNLSEDLELKVSLGATQLSTLVEKAREGDREAFEKLIVLHQDEIFRLVFFRTRSKIDSEDLTQDIFFSAFKYLPQLKDSDRFRPWLYRIALNRVHDFHRKNKFLAYLGMTESREDADVPDIEPHRNPGALDTVIRKEFWAHVKRLAKRFSRMEKEVFFLRFVDELNLREIAETLHKSESAVKTHLYRAIRKFKEDTSLSDFLQGEWQGEKDKPS